MSAEVYANGSAIACKAGDGKVIASFPDVCMSPPPPPAGPIPVPYPNTSFSKDMKKGSKTVKIKNKEVMLKDQSFYKTAPLGDEAASRNFGANILSHVITGKTYFVAWSGDVKFEGKNVDRHIDFTTSNHASYPAGVLTPNPEMEKLALGRIEQEQCPCCGKEDCPAAFTKEDKENNNKLGFKEYYKIEPGSKREQEFNDLMAYKNGLCECEEGNEVFPSPPCDVFREDDSDRRARIEEIWNQYRDQYQQKHGLKDQLYFIEQIVQTHPDREKLLSIKSQLSSLRKGDRRLAEYKKEVSTPASRLARTNHRVPKVAGGCPGHEGHEGNLQPQQKLCDACQEIDQFMTDNWQG